MAKIVGRQLPWVRKYESVELEIHLTLKIANIATPNPNASESLLIFHYCNTEKLLKSYRIALIKEDLSIVEFIFR